MKSSDGNRSIFSAGLKRRDFLGQCAAGVLAVGASSCRTAPRENYSGGIIDAHVHFYDPARPQGVPWPPPEDGLLYRTVLPEEFKELARPLGIEGALVIEASSWLEDNQWLLDLADQEPFILGVVGNLEPGSPDFRRQLDRFAAHPLFRGIRIGGTTLNQRIDDPRFLEDVRQLADRDLSIDLLGSQGMLPTVGRLGHSIPELRIMIDHVANIRIGPEAPDNLWIQNLRIASAQPNVFCKLSGLAEGAQAAGEAAPSDSDFYRLHLEVIWSFFGEDRLVFGSNWPVCTRRAPLEQVVNLVNRFVSDQGASAPRKVFRENSRRFYRWRERGAG